MRLILGGAYQGKLAFAKTRFGLKEDDVFSCQSDEIDFSFRCIDRLEEYTLACVRAGKDPLALFAAHRAEWSDSVLICRDIFCGVVPLDPLDRAWRQATGHLCRMLADEAEQVSRIFCGLELRLK